MSVGYRSSDPLINDWLRMLYSAEGKSPATCKGYAIDVEQFGWRLGGFAQLPAADTDRIQIFLMELIEMSMQKVTVRRKLASLRSFYAYLKFKKIRQDNPASEARSPKPDQRLPKTMHEDEIQRILDVDITHAGKSNRTRSDFHQARDHAIMQLLYASGLRRAEIVALNLKDVDLVEKSLRVIGKGNKERAVVFSDEAAETMRAYLNLRPHTCDEAFFVGRSGARLSDRSIWLIFKAFADRSGVTTKVTPHVMRHSFATHLLDNGAHLVTIKELLGHKSLATTGIYMHLSRESIRVNYDQAKARQREKNALANVIHPCP
jgi:integrase/recombinase XerC